MKKLKIRLSILESLIFFTYNSCVRYYKELMILTAASALAMLLAVAAKENVGNLILSRFVDLNVDEYMAEWLAALNLKAGVLELDDTLTIELLILLIIYGISFVRYIIEYMRGRGEDHEAKRI